MVYGYMNRILRVDLSLKRFNVQKLDENIIKKYIGGYGIGGKILYDELPSWSSPYDPENLLIFGTGPITGTQTPTASRYVVVTKSPLSGYFGDANSGGYFGPMMKWSGFDFIVFKGISKDPVYLYVNNGEFEIRSAKDYWGMNARETERALKKDLGDNEIKVAAIGQASENLVRYAAIMSDEAGRAAARLGVGAVMGSKKLKAVVVKGDMKIPVADPDKLKKVSNEIIKFQMKDPGVKTTRDGGTPSFLTFGWQTGDTPSFNWNDEEYGEYDVNKIAWPGEYEKVLKEHRACYFCTVSCRRIMPGYKYGKYTVEDGAEGVEYETLDMFGPMTGIDDIKAIGVANELANLYGIDTISLGATIAFAMEAYEKGIIDRNITDGIDLRFGNAEAFLEMIEKIAFRKGFGNILAEGSRRAGLIIGNDAEKLSMSVKGVEIAAHDPRAFQGGSVHYAATPTGGRHMEGYTVGPEIMGAVRPDVHFVSPDEIKKIGPQSLEKKVLIVKRQEDFWALLSAMGMCIFTEDVPAYPNEHVYFDIFKYVTGIPLTLEDGMRAGERIFNLKKMFNVKHGATRDDDKLPERLYESPNKRAGGTVAKDSVFLEEYYEVRGWDRKSGIPTEKNLKELDLI